MKSEMFAKQLLLVVVVLALIWTSSAATTLVTLDVKAPVTTASLQTAIDTAAETGGKVVVPRGEWTIGTVWLRSRVELHLPEGAVLRGSADLADYNATNAYVQNFGSQAEGYRDGEG